MRRPPNSSGIFSSAQPDNRIPQRLLGDFLFTVAERTAVCYSNREVEHYKGQVKSMNVICYGDSNTYGYDGRSFIPECFEEPWPRVLQNISGWKVMNQGENGREIPKGTVCFPEGTDLLIIMLGTNDLLQFWTPKGASQKMEVFLENINIPMDRILIISPPYIKPGAWVEDPDLIEDSRALALEYRALSQRLGVMFLDAGEWEIPIAYDGVHITQEGHKQFAEQLYKRLINAL